ncbi:MULTISPECIES: hypothetical protein [unclassified Streptomyces]|uniref:hypothetical protein n=1 Tax=unclassified Streptomyces TaxID=2593676 RepID=UPI0020358366|nr:MULTISPECIES: hypothetical protein [unclassified Streptomyces]
MHIAQLRSSTPTSAATSVPRRAQWPSPRSRTTQGGTALVVAAVVGNLLGIVAAWRRGGVLDSAFPPLLKQDVLLARRAVLGHARPAQAGAVGPR